MNDTLKDRIETIGRQARAASRSISRAETAQKNEALLAIAHALEAGMDELILEN